MQVPDLKRKVQCRTIANGIDLESCPFVDRQPGFNLAYVGYINHKKNPSLLLQALRYLVDRDPRYVLHVAGVHQELRFELYMEHMIREMGLQRHIRFYGWIDDVGTWLADKHYIVSTSVLESFGYGIVEAMACGLKPVIHNFVGARELFPEQYLFNSVADFARQVMDAAYTPETYRRFVQEHYGRQRQLSAMERLLKEVVVDPERE